MKKLDNSLSEMVIRMDDMKRQALEKMARHGWYPHPRWMDGTSEFLAHKLSFDEGQGNALMCEFVEHMVDSIESDLTAQFPARARLITAAVGAHRRKEYALSIPVLLAQADGICQESKAVQLYSRRDKVPALVRELGAASEPGNTFLVSILDVFPMIWGEGERQQHVGEDFLNRHAVLHGESVDYDTHVNGCRAISYLRYVAWILKARS